MSKYPNVKPDPVPSDGQGGDKRFALAGFHFGNFPLMQDDAAGQLRIEVAHVQSALARLAHDRKRLRQQIVEAFAVRHSLFELIGLGGELFVAQGGNVRLQRVDPVNRRIDLF